MRVGSPRDLDLLLEREGELAVLECCRLASARAGSGALALVEGAGGIGKTRLLLEGQRIAAAARMRALRARGSELEREFPYGVERQLLEPALFARGAGDRHELLAGAAALAGPLSASNPTRASPRRGSRPSAPARSCTACTRSSTSPPASSSPTRWHAEPIARLHALRRWR